MKPTLLSGVKPTGRPHIANYFGAMKQFVDFQDTYDAWIFVANYHALTTIRDPQLMKEGQRDLIIDYLAIGLDPTKATLYLQTSVPQTTELAWIFQCLTTVPYLERAHAYKDAVANGKEPNAGLFNYPMLMAADILLPDADVVPVGKDQKQHIEYARDVAIKFNNAYGDVFKLPKEMIIERVETVPGNDGRKMSKSYNNHLPLFSSYEDIQTYAMSVVTASVPKGTPVDPHTDNVFSIYKLVSTEEEQRTMINGYRSGTLGFKDAKGLLAEALERFISPLREKRTEIEKGGHYIEKVIKEGGEKAYERYESKMKTVRKAVGINT